MRPPTYLYAFVPDAGAGLGDYVPGERLSESDDPPPGHASVRVEAGEMHDDGSRLVRSEDGTWSADGPIGPWYLTGT